MNTSFQDLGFEENDASPFEDLGFEESKGKPPSKKTPAGRAGRALSRGALKTLGDVFDFMKVEVDPERYPEEKFSFRESVDKLLPQAEDAGFAEKTLERGAEILPYLLGGEAAILPKLGRVGLSALLGQSAEELGGGELAQTAAEITGLGLPGLRKKIAPKKAQEKGIEMLRRRGVTEKEIAPLVPSERKAETLGKIGTRYQRTERARKGTKEALENVYSQIKTEGKDLPILSTNRTLTLERELQESLKDLPSSLRKIMESETEKLFHKPVKANDLISYWQEINSNINWKNVINKKSQLNSLKSPILSAMKEISPDLASDFELTNQFYSKFKKVSKNLKPKDFERWVAVSELMSGIGGMVKFGPKVLVGIIGAEGTRRLSSEMLINPRLQNLTKQMGRAVKNNKIPMARKLEKEFIKELKKKDIDIEKLTESTSTETSE